MARGNFLKECGGERTVLNVEPCVQVPNTVDGRGILPRGVDWSDVRYLVAVGEAQSLRGAARELRVAVNTVRARLARLERALGSPVISRETKGTILTPVGSRLCKAAGSLVLADLTDDYDARQCLLAPNILTLGCTEGVGTSWLTPRVADLAKRIDPVTIDMQFDYDLNRDRASQVDIGLAFRRPLDPNLIVAKLATLHFLFFASPGYLATHGTPQTIDDLRTHTLVEQGGPGYNETAVDLILGSDRDHSLTKIRTNSSLTQAYATANGAGIAILPSYTRVITSTLVPLPVTINIRVPLYYFYREQARHSPVVRATVDWFREIFDPVKFPWFAETFVHPDAFSRRQMREAQLVDIFRHMIDRVDFS